LYILTAATKSAAGLRMLFRQMPLMESYANLRCALEPADAGSVTRTRVDDDDGRLGLIKAILHAGVAVGVDL